MNYIVTSWNKEQIDTVKKLCELEDLELWIHGFGFTFQYFLFYKIFITTKEELHILFFIFWKWRVDWSLSKID